MLRKLFSQPPSQTAPPLEFSTVWKTFFHTVENPAYFFHALDPACAGPHCGKAECRVRISSAWQIGRTLRVSRRPASTCSLGRACTVAQVFPKAVGMTGRIFDSVQRVSLKADHQTGSVCSPRFSVRLPGSLWNGTPPRVDPTHIEALHIINAQH